MSSHRSTRPSDATVVSTMALTLMVLTGLVGLSTTSGDVEISLSPISSAYAATPADLSNAVAANDARDVDGPWNADRSAQGTSPDEAH